MDVNLFTRMLVSLLSRNGRAVLNDFGTFTTQVMPACFSDKGFTLNPPYIRVLFTQGAERDDAFAQLYAQSNGVDLRQAEMIIGSQVAQIRKEVLDKKTVTLPGLGRLRATSASEVFFVPGEDLKLFPSYDCLESISLKSLAQPIPEPAAPEPQPEIQVSEPPALEKSVPKPAVETLPENEPAAPEPPVQEPQSEIPAPEPPAPTPQQEEKRRGAISPFGWVLIVLLILAAVFFAALAAAGRLYPDFVDRWLYTPEQLEILRYKF